MNLKRVQELHAHALELESDERAQYLDAACAGNDELRAEVESLLVARATMGSFLDEPAARAVEPKTLAAGTRIRSYEIVRILGTGGAGTVYEALQENPRRRVALKVLRSRFSSEAAQLRFRDEGEILAKLKHPSVATIYEAGVFEGTPWFAMEYVTATGTLLDSARELPRRKQLGLFVQICDAVHHGHQHGIIHRDLKPANVLVDETGRPKVIDFGISSGTQIAGTLDYMSPEQCEPGQEHVDVRSDVYALGVLLCELLTQRLPRDVGGLSIAEALCNIREEQAVPRGLRGDLDAIVRKALAPREGRYASAAALADDVRRHLEDRPVEACAGGMLYQLKKFARRERLAFSALVGAVAVLVAAVIVSRGQAIAREKERETAEFQAYVANIAAAAAALRVHDVADARQRLELAPPHLRNWEWHHFYRRLDQSAETRSVDGEFYGGAVSGDGTVVAGACAADDYWVTVWDSNGKREIARSGSFIPAVALDRRGRRVGLGYSSGLVELRDVGTDRVLHRLEGHTSVINAVEFDAQDRWLATASKDMTVILWDVHTGARRHTLREHTDRVINVAFHGDRLATAGREGAVCIWNAVSGDLIRRIAAHDGSVEGVAFSPDGERLASVSRDQSLKIWNADTGSLLATGRGHENNIRAVAFSPDGATVATASYDYTVRLWRAADAREVACLRGHSRIVRDVRFEPDGRRLITFSADGTARFWAVTEHGGVPVLRGHVGRIHVAFSPDGRRLVSGSHDGTVRLWNPETHRMISVLGTELGQVKAVTWSANGSRVLATSTKSTTVFLMAGGTPHRSAGGRTAALAGAGRFFVGYGHRIEVLGSDRGWKAHAATIYSLARHGGRIASAAGGELAVWNTATFQELSRSRLHRETIWSVAFSPDGRLLATASNDGTIKVVDAGSLEELATLKGHQGGALAVAFSPDGTRLASGGGDRTVRLWDVERVTQVAVLHGHANPVWSVTFSPDGRRLASAGGELETRDSSIRLWEID